MTCLLNPRTKFRQSSKIYIKSVFGKWGWKLFVFIDFGDICKFGKASSGVLGSFGLKSIGRLWESLGAKIDRASLRVLESFSEASNCQTQLQTNTQQANIRKPLKLESLKI